MTAIPLSALPAERRESGETEPAVQAQSHCCAPTQQSHLSIRSNLTAAYAAISLRPVAVALRTSYFVFHIS